VFGLIMSLPRLAAMLARQATEQPVPLSAAYSLDHVDSDELSGFEACSAREERCRSDTRLIWEKQYDKAAIGFVLSGWFDYRAEGGRLTAVPGTVLFGNVGEHFSVHHLDSLGNRRLVVWYDRSFLEAIAAAHGLDQARFRSLALPPGKASSGLFALMQSLARRNGATEEAACALAATALTIDQQGRRASVVSGRDRRRILAIVGHIEQAFCETCSVSELAALSGFSRYHFMRLFKAVTGQSANQYVIATRLRAAVTRIMQTRAPMSQIAFDVGFNDLSHFNTSFRSMFNCTPRQMRRSSFGA
jgi:AraC family transcriptional regulator